MKHLLDILSRALSVVFYPLFVPTYGILLFCIGLKMQTGILPAIYWWVAIGGTFIFTCFIPLTLILYMLRKRQIRSLDMTDPKERKMPYLYTLGGYVFWAYFVIAVLEGPSWMIATSIGATVVLAIVALINGFWKISAHSAGIGGLTGGVCAYSLYYSVMPTALILTMFGISLLLMYARLYANAHSSHQVVAGYLLGIIGTFIPAFLTSLYA